MLAKTYSSKCGTVRTVTIFQSLTESVMTVQCDDYPSRQLRVKVNDKH